MLDTTTIVKKFFANKDWKAEPHNLYDPIDYAMQSGGKRLRPNLVLMAANLFGADVDKLMIPAAAMETFHNFTLLHDDVMDHAEVRRGRPTVHKKWDENTAILSGDAMLVKAYQMIEEGVEEKYLRSALRLFSQTALEVCEGQQYDADFEHCDNVTLDDYYKMVRLKTGVLLAACIKMGALLAGADEEDQQNLYEFGINVGIAFQIWDDYLDCYGDEKTFGKKIGGDIVCGKRSFLLVNALKDGKASQIQTIHQLIGSTKIADEQKITTIIGMYTQLGLPERCKDAMDEYYQRAMEYLGKVKKSEAEKKVFVQFANALMGRNL